MLFKSEANSGAVAKTAYLPNLGYIGKQKLSVPNYLFPRSDGAILPRAAGYPHCQDLTNFLLTRPIEEHYRKSRALTRFLRKREMTFAKRTRFGTYRIFDVPCTATPLSMPKSLFDSLERSSQVLIAALRLVLQDLYGAPNARSAEFVKSLPKEVRRVFIQAVEKCPHYFPQLHHPVMREYPFFDVVGLDLVLTEDYSSANRAASGGLDRLPFRLLELNAGSPSGASNNFHLLEGLAQVDPDILQQLGKVMPNDHYQVLGETYRSLGEAWTGRRDGIQIILPPGGENGATPEIHRLASNSGLIYADPGQLYRDADGFIHLRTVGAADPVVTAVYSRVNSDSALFDPARGLILRDAESGKPIYLMDTLAVGKNSKPLRNASGERIPLESNYAIPGAIASIHERKLYVGGLNRVLDNKIILDTLCRFAPSFFRTRLQELDLDPEKVTPVSPPDTLSSSSEAHEIISRNPEEWVIKSPSLSGGNGVHILKTMSRQQRQDILAKVKEDPTQYAYQKLVRIGRLPVATIQRDRSAGAGRAIRGGNTQFRFANLAADLRMWVFYGAGDGNRVPRLTHNALTRLAPQEQGPLSSIVNTSKGGGYAPMVVVDDIGHPAALPVLDMIRAPLQIRSDLELPCFVAAQIVQVAHMIEELERSLREERADAYNTYGLLLDLKKQCREILSFLHAENIELINEMITSVRVLSQSGQTYTVLQDRNRAKIHVTTLLRRMERSLPPEFYGELENLRALNQDISRSPYQIHDQLEDMRILKSLRLIGQRLSLDAPGRTRLRSLLAHLSRLIRARPPLRRLALESRTRLLGRIDQFRRRAAEHLATHQGGAEFARLFAVSDSLRTVEFDILFAESPAHRASATLAPGQSARDATALIASEEELRTGRLLVETEEVPGELRAARSDWLKVRQAAEALPLSKRDAFLKSARTTHFAKHPSLSKYQALLSSSATDLTTMLELLEILPYARYNLRQFAAQQGVSVEALFMASLTDRRISRLTQETRRAIGLKASFAGECFALKRRSHGLFSDSQIFLWVSAELPALIQGYTVGHELIHFQQIRAMMDCERRALNEGPAQAAEFFNFYGNFLGLTSGTLETLSADAVLNRKPIYGFAGLIDRPNGDHWITEVRKALVRGSAAWNDIASRYGSLLGYSTEVSVQVRVKAIREVIPALENAKNLRFVKDLGLELEGVDEIQSALPIANAAQLERHRATVSRAIYSPALDWEALRVIGSHQYFGVRFPRRNRPEENLTLRPMLKALVLGGSYNQTQQ